MSHFQLLQLPNEIILLISDSLPMEDAVCAALTCKRLFFLIFSRKVKLMRLQPSAKGMLLCRLEKDIIGVFYCHFNQKLMRFDSNGKSKAFTLWLIKSSQLRDGECASAAVKFISSAFMLCYYRARLVTNYQLLGPQHGIPPSSLSYVTPTFVIMPYLEHVCRKEAWAAKLIGDELFLSATHKLFYDQVHAKALQSYLTSKSFYICKHMSVGLYYRKGDNINLPAIDRNSATDSNYYSTGSCRFCSTDWDAAIEWIGARHGWMVTITTYHDLGSCRSPFDRKWQAMARSHRRFAYRDAPSGIVKHKWIHG
ncbi:hypothetical protein F5X96DRAFT_660045 [Biscogniauxia mediterranea]|nr:hypothetical protein F5X96DRAFT_660045 [Biscogniauxia mediterranea]